jgi:hypothetical protein
MSNRVILRYDGDDARGRGGARSNAMVVVRWERFVRTSVSTTMRLVGLLAVGIFCGCGDAGKPATPSDDHDIRTLIGYVGEYHADPKRFETFFVDGRVPDTATRAKLRGMMTKLERALVDDTGSSATADVVYEVLETGEILGPVQWKLAKAEDQWKVSVFALPGGSAASP